MENGLVDQEREIKGLFYWYLVYKKGITHPTALKISFGERREIQIKLGHS